MEEKYPTHESIRKGPTCPSPALQAMEAVGAAASLYTLAKTAKDAYVLSDAIYRGLRYARQEMGHVRKQLEQIQVLITLLRTLEHHEVYNFLELADDQKESVANAIDIARTQLRDVQRECASRVVKDGRRAYLKWAFNDRAHVGDILSRLQFVLGTLNAALISLQIVATVNSTSQQESSASQLQRTTDVILDEINQMKVSLSQNEQQHTTHVETPTVSDISNNSETRRPSQDPLTYLPSKRPLGSLGSYMGIDVVVASAYNSNMSACRIFFKVPLPGFFARQTLWLDLSLASFHSWSFAIERAICGVSNIIPSDSEVVEACRRGDLSCVQKLFNSKRAGPNDYTPDGRPILRHAIKGGSIELTRWLLCHGADATALSGDSQAVLLQGAFLHRKADIARLLIDNRADVDHVGADRYTPLFNLFNEGESAGSCDEFLDLLAANDFQNMNMQTSTGWTALHRAAAWGTKGDVKSLMQRGASPELCTTSLNWTPMSQAVRYNNKDAFEELVGLSPNDAVKHVDARNWTLLHIAAHYSSFDLVARLLELGVDPHCQSEPSTICIPPALRNLKLTASDLAKQKGPEEHQKFLNVLRRGGFDVEADDQGEVFWIGEEM